MKTTKKHSEYWKNRKIDWQKAYQSTWDHPHRGMIAQTLGMFRWSSLFEVGCASGPNLMRILKHFDNVQIGGMDINPEAIELAQQTFKGAFLKVGSAEDIMMSDNSVDVVLADMTLIYIGPRKIDKVISEMKRVARHHIVLCELHSTSIFDRIKLWWNSGYFMYNYKKLLEKHGFHDVQMLKIPKEVWDGKPQVPYGYIIKAKVPKDYN